MTIPYDQMRQAIAEAHVRVQDYAAAEVSTAIFNVLANGLDDGQADLLAQIRWEIDIEDDQDETPVSGTVRSLHPPDGARVVTRFAEEFGDGRIHIVDGSHYVITIEAAAVVAGFAVAVTAVWWTSESGQPRPNRDEVQAQVTQAAAARLEILPGVYDLDDVAEYDPAEFD